MGSKTKRQEESRGQGLPKVEAATIEISHRFEFPVLGIGLFTAEGDHLWGARYRIPYFVANIPNFERNKGRLFDAEEWTDIAHMVGNALESGGVRVTYRLEEGAILDERIP